MSIRTKIFLACLSLTAVTLAFGLVTRSAQSQLSDLAVKLYDESFMSMSYLRSAQNTLLTISHDVAAGRGNVDNLVERLDNAVGDISVSYERAMSAQGRQISQQLDERLDRIARGFRTTHSLPSRAELAELEAMFDTAVEVNAGDGFRSRRAATELVSRLSLQTWSAMALSLAIALAITFLLSRTIVPAVRHAVGIAAAIAAGRLDNVIEVRGRSETSVLLRALAVMQHSIAEKIERIEHLMAKQATTHADEMALQFARFEAALDNMVQGLCMFDVSGRVLVHNRRFAEMFQSSAIGTSMHDALPAGLLRQGRAGGGAAQACSFTHKLEDDRRIAVTEQPMDGDGWVATYEDVSERHLVEARMEFMARHDTLTGLPNRTMYHEQMQQALALARRGGSLAVLCLDLDRFKAFNDTLGHTVGDVLLRAVAQRLQRETREADLVVRLGSDEFAIIQSSATQPGESKALAERLVKAIGEPFELAEHTLSMGISVGIAITADGLTDAETLLKSADLALQRAKDDGRGTYRFFETEMDAQMQARRHLEIDLRQAIAERQFQNFYQPLVDVSTRAINGFEALVRWKHPTRGMVSPREFIPVAEEMGLIAAIGALVLEQACFDGLSWPAHIKVAVNLSPLQFRNLELAAEVAAVLERSGLPASRLELEVTESLLLQDSNVILTILREIKALGVHISMDDFGTGYSSLSYLGRFPFDKIKIDQSFVRHLDKRDDCIAIVRAVLSLGNSLGMRVIAEGVETEEQLAILQAEGCEQVQGYLFSKPKPKEAFANVFDVREVESVA